MGNIYVYEAERGYLDYTLSYGTDWSEPEKRGLPIPRTDTIKVYFYIKNDYSDDTPLIALTDDASQQIEWLDEENGKLRVQLGTVTLGKAGNDKVYELRIHLGDGSWMTVQIGKIDIRPSVVRIPSS